MWEAMVAEMRATNAEYDHRRHFTEEKRPIVDSRAFLADLMSPGIPIDNEAVASKNATNLRMAANDNLIEVG